MMKNAVEVRGLTVVRGRTTVLDGLDLDIGGGVTGLLGPSGCGKTTLMRALVGVQQVRSGTVTVFGEPAGSPPLRDRVGYVTQAASVYDDLTVAENLRFFAQVLGVGPDEVERSAAAVDLTEHLDQVVGTMSGGQRSRASLAVALLKEPDLLVLDEPTVGLDPVIRQELWGRFTDLAAGGTSILVSSHVMDEAARCDRLLLLRGGQLMGDDTPQRIRAQAGTDDLEEAFLRLIRRDEQRAAA